MIWVLVTAPQLIRVIYGPKWISAIPLVQILALTAAVQSILAAVGLTYMSQGRTDILFKWSIVSTSVFSISFAVGLRWGVLGVAIAYSIATYSITYPSFAIAFRLIDLKVKDFLARLWSIVLATLILGAIAFLLRISLERLGVTQNVIILAIVTAASLLSYFALVFVLDKELFVGAVDLLAQLRSAPKND